MSFICIASLHSSFKDLSNSRPPVDIFATGGTYIPAFICIFHNGIGQTPMNGAMIKKRYRTIAEQLSNLYTEIIHINTAY